jgi:predicted tellurium resistance membrane protein TerC
MDAMIPSIDLTGKSIILLFGGIFLIGKSTTEIFEKFEMKKEKPIKKKRKISFPFIVAQIIMLDIVFSFDSILTAIGLVDSIIIIVTAMLVSMIIMVFCSASVSRFISKFPSLQILALAFLILIGFTLLTEAVGIEIPKGYIYFAIIFSLIIELVNIRIRKRKQKQLVVAIQ